MSIEYRQPADVQGHKAATFQLTPQSPGPKQFETYLNPSRDLDFQIGIQHHFDASSGWTGEKQSYELPPRRSPDRTLHVDAIGVESRTTMRRPSNSTMSSGWCPRAARSCGAFRLTRPEQRGWTARFTHHLKNGTVLASGPIHGGASFLPVGRPLRSGTGHPRRPSLRAQHCTERLPGHRVRGRGQLLQPSGAAGDPRHDNRARAAAHRHARCHPADLPPAHNPGDERRHHPAGAGRRRRDDYWPRRGAVREAVRCLAVALTGITVLPPLLDAAVDRMEGSNWPEVASIWSRLTPTASLWSWRRSTRGRAEAGACGGPPKSPDPNCRRPTSCPRQPRC